MLSFLATILSTWCSFTSSFRALRWGIRPWATGNYFVAGGLLMLAGGVDAMHASIQAPWIVPSLIGVCFYPLPVDRHVLSRASASGHHCDQTVDGHPRLGVGLGRRHARNPLGTVAGPLLALPCSLPSSLR